MASGVLNVLIVSHVAANESLRRLIFEGRCKAIPLAFKQRRARSLPQLRPREVFFDFNVGQRLCFWKPIPELAYIMAYDRNGLDAIKARMGEHDDDNQDQGHDDEKYASDIESRGGEDGGDYPTFTGGSLTDPKSQIERFDKRQRGDERSDDDGSEDDEEYLDEAEPTPPEVMPGIPPQLQGIVRDVRPRFGSISAVPAINLMPSTPSTIASRSRSGSRPQTMSSVMSGSSEGSTKSRRMTLIQEAARSFPSPPDRPVDVEVPKSKPKAHLVNPKMDESRLMPPKKRGGRSRSSSSGELLQMSRPTPRRATSVDVESPTGTIQDLSRWKMPVRPVSAMKNPAGKSRQSVRFDLKRSSSESTSSVREPSHRVQAGYPAAYVEDEEAYSAYASEESTELTYRCRV
jgi:hypothetical protein